jgi:hypothetical protein
MSLSHLLLVEQLTFVVSIILDTITLSQSPYLVSIGYSACLHFFHGGQDLASTQKDVRAPIRFAFEHFDDFAVSRDSFVTFGNQSDNSNEVAFESCTVHQTSR